MQNQKAFFQVRLQMACSTSTYLPAGRASIFQVDCRSFKRFFWCTVETAVVKNTRLIFFVAIRIESHRPTIFISKVTQAAEVSGEISQTFNILFTGFAKYRSVKIRRNIGLCIRINVTQLPVETDVNAGVFFRVMLLGIRQNAV